MQWISIWMIDFTFHDHEVLKALGIWLRAFYVHGVARTCGVMETRHPRVNSEVMRRRSSGSGGANYQLLATNYKLVLHFVRLNFKPINLTHYEILTQNPR